jgi:Flp pilus assembly protein TadG
MRLISWTKRRERARGQALAEFALVFPIFALVLFGVISLGLWVFYQQQLSGAAREAARYAAIHSSSAQCPHGVED